MEMLVWIGAGLTMLGMAGVIYAMIAVAGAKRRNLTDDEMRKHITKMIPINLGALFVAMIGLMMVIIGLVLS